MRRRLSLKADEEGAKREREEVFFLSLSLSPFLPKKEM